MSSSPAFATEGVPVIAQVINTGLLFALLYFLAKKPIVKPFTKRSKNIKYSNATDIIFGYIIINDVTARKLQNNHKQWFIGKSPDTYCPIGPCIITKDEIKDIKNIDIDPHLPSFCSIVLEIYGKILNSLGLSLTVSTSFHVGMSVSHIN